MKQPSTNTFWRFIFATILFFALLAYRDLLRVTQRLNIDISTSKPWISLWVLLGLFTLGVLALLVFSFSKKGTYLFAFFESFSARPPRLFGGLLLLLGLSGFAAYTSIPYFIRVLGGANSVRYLVLVIFTIIGVLGFKLLRNETPWMTAFIVVLMGQALIQLILVFFAQVTAYPFAMGWSETSRFYFPSLFVSEKVYGQKFPWPILHPTLHLLLAPPYLLDAPLWFHRLWQVMLRFVLIGLIIPPLLRRLKIEDQKLRWLVALWMFLFLFTGPIYFHLAIPVILVLWGFSAQNGSRTWVAVLLASIWAGWSRVNWYPVPAMIAAVLYFLEEPVNAKRWWKYLLKPFLWFVIGTTVAFLSQRVYIALSGVGETSSFYSSFSSNLLWFRLWPNASYSLGLLPAILLVSLPLWIVIYLVLRTEKGKAWNSIRLLMILAALLVLFIGGLLVGLKIGGGVDVHNWDAYFVVLLIIFSYLLFAQYRLENGELSKSISLSWILVLALIFMPAWSYLRFNIRPQIYDAQKTQNVLKSLQSYVDDANTQGGDILFITQRHLISMHMLNGVQLIPEYEREDLMEMAMSNNTEYLNKFRADMERQRFALIVVDPLNYNLMTRNRSFADENNVWVRRVMKQILCNYRQEAVFAEDDIALYVPQMGQRQCPQQ